MSNDDDKKRVSIKLVTGVPWFTGWLFTIGFAHLTITQSIVALVAWPVFLGGAIR